MNEKPIARVALVGLGPIGVEVARAVIGRPGLEILGAADPAPDKAGKDLRELARYVVANPLRAGLVQSLRDYPHWDAEWL